MANIVLFHSAYGLRPAVHAAAERLRSIGHTVATPDLYAGRVVDHIGDALDLRDEIGDETLRQRAAEAVADIPAGTVLAGYSLGAWYAHGVGVNDPRVAALLMLHGIGELPAQVTPGLRVQLHLAEKDDFESDEDVAAWHAALERAGATVETFRYPGGHVYTDPDLPDYDPASAQVTWGRAEEFLAGLT